MRNTDGGTRMKGAINYLQAVRDICRKYKGDCKACPLGDKPRIDDNICPRLTNPSTWSDGWIANMVSIKTGVSEVL